MVIEFVQQRAAELLAALAIVVAIASNWRAKKQSRRAAEHERRLASLERASRQTEYLVELERKNSAVSQFALVTAQKLLLLRDNPGSSTRHPGEEERLANNLELMQEFRDDEEKERELAGHQSIGSDPEQYHKALMNTRRLCIRIEGEVKKEREVYSELLHGSDGGAV